MAFRKGAALIYTLMVVFIIFLFTLFWIKSTKIIQENDEKLLDAINVEFKIDSIPEDLKFYLLTAKRNNIGYENHQLLTKLPPVLKVNGEEIKLDKAGNVKLSLRDVNTKLFIGSLYPTTLSRLFNTLNLKNTPTLLDSFMDWIDTDSLSRSNGAEDNYYTNVLGAKYIPRNNRAIQTPEELKLIRGFNELQDQDFEKLTQNLSTYSSFPLNVRGMSKELLAAVLDLPVQLVSTFNFQTMTQEEFERTLRQLGKVNLYDVLTLLPSRRLQVKLYVKIGSAQKDVNFIIDFNAEKEPPVRILEWID